MKRTYISPEFDYRPVYGTYTMIDTYSFFGSVMMRVEDKIEILDQNLTFNQLQTGEQLDEASELILPQIIYDTSTNKSLNHTLELAVDQTEFQKENSAKWILTIEAKDILRNHFFAILKSSRTFEGLKNEHVLSGNVDQAIFEYINNNILKKYAFKELNLYLDYVDLCNDDTLQYLNAFDQTIVQESLKLSTLEQSVSSDESIITLRFNQAKPAYNFSYKYYFNLYYEKL